MNAFYYIFKRLFILTRLRVNWWMARIIYFMIACRLYPVIPHALHTKNLLYLHCPLAWEPCIKVLSPLALISSFCLWLSKSIRKTLRRSLCSPPSPSFMVSKCSSCLPICGYSPPSYPSRRSAHSPRYSVDTHSGWIPCRCWVVLMIASLVNFTELASITTIIAIDYPFRGATTAIISWSVSLSSSIPLSSSGPSVLSSTPSARALSQTAHPYRSGRRCPQMNGYLLPPLLLVCFDFVKGPNLPLQKLTFLSQVDDSKLLVLSQKSSHWEGIQSPSPYFHLVSVKIRRNLLSYS